MDSFFGFTSLRAIFISEGPAIYWNDSAGFPFHERELNLSPIWHFARFAVDEGSHMKDRDGRVSVGWTQWLSFNSNNLVWIALVVGGVLFTSLLMKL